VLHRLSTLFRQGAQVVLLPRMRVPHSSHQVCIQYSTVHFTTLRRSVLLSQWQCLTVAVAVCHYCKVPLVQVPLWRCNLSVSVPQCYSASVS